MGMFDKLKFWKKKEQDLGLSPGLGMKDETGLGTPDFGQQPFQPSPQNFQPSFQPLQPQMESFQGFKSYAENKDIELVLAKLDSIKAMIDNINQRLANLERAAYGQQQYGYNPEEQRKRTW